MIDVLALAQEMVRIDSRSSVSNLRLLEFLQMRLLNWNIERIDYVDDIGIRKVNLVARWPTSSSRAVFAGHLDTVSAAGWTTNPFSALIQDGRLVGLGAADMKGPVAAILCAAERTPEDIRPMIVLTADEETTKRGAREVVARSSLLQEYAPSCFIVGEPTSLSVVRGHRADVQFIVTARGVQAHSSTGKGLNANIALIPFLADLRLLHLRLRDDESLHDPQYDPPFCDLNFIIDNHGTLPNTTVGLATCRIKFRYSKAIDPKPVIDEVEAMAKRWCLAIIVRPEAPPPELPANAPLVQTVERLVGGRARVMGLGTEASEYSRLAPSLVLGPGNLDDAHRPQESIKVQELYQACAVFEDLGSLLAGRLGP